MTNKPKDFGDCMFVSHPQPHEKINSTDLTEIKIWDVFSLA